MDGLTLKILRIESGLRQYQVAAKVGIPPTKLCEIEAGRRKPSDDLLKRILLVITGNDDGNRAPRGNAGVVETEGQLKMQAAKRRRSRGQVQG
mgnify:CR=1 FL=1